MKYLLILLFSIKALSTKGQAIEYPFHQLYQLDSIGKSVSISRYFGELYFNFLQSIESQLAPADSSTKKLIRRFEANFAQFYIDACTEYKYCQEINCRDWQAYFLDSSLKPIHYILLGTNAHLNGRLWQAIDNSFTPEEMQGLKKEFRIFKRSLNKTYRKVFREAVASLKEINILNKFTLGIDELAGYYYLYKWRKREMRLARLYFSDKQRFNNLLARVNNKQEFFNKLIFNLR